MARLGQDRKWHMANREYRWYNTVLSEDTIDSRIKKINLGCKGLHEVGVKWLGVKWLSVIEGVMYQENLMLNCAMYPQIMEHDK